MLGLTVLLLEVPFGASAQQLSGLSVDPPHAVVNQSVANIISLSKDNDSFYCGLVVSMGDGNVREIRITEKETPLKVEHQYMVPGTYAVTVEGKLLIRGFKTAPACGGIAISTPVVIVAKKSPGEVPSVQDESEELRRTADDGDTNAMYRLGNIVAQQGANVDAARYFRAASERGHVKAANALGFMYEEGRGVPQNFEQARELYLRAMKKGNADAMVNRGLLYANGLGTTKDPVQAYMHFLLAGAYAQDQETRDTALKLRDQIAANLSKQQLARGQTMADKFAKKEIR